MNVNGVKVGYMRVSTADGSQKLDMQETALIEARIRDINTKIDMVGAIQRNMAGNYAGKVQGIMIGLAFTLIIGVLFLMF